MGYSLCRKDLANDYDVACLNILHPPVVVVSTSTKMRVYLGVKIAVQLSILKLQRYTYIHLIN